MAPRKSSSLDEQEKLATDIKKIRKNIRKKHQALTQNVIDEELLTEKSLKPIITPLQKLVQEKTNSLSDKNKEERIDVEMDDIQSRLKNKRSLDEQENESLANKRIVIDPELQTTELPLLLPHEETVYETLPTVRELLSTPEGRKSADYYIDNWYKGHLVKRYIRNFFDDNNHNIDRVFGPYFGNDDILMLGKYSIKFEDDDIIINDVKYKGTPGLYELIFMKRPDEYVFTEEDLTTYSRIINETAAYLNLSTNKIKSSSSYKYRNIIKPIINNIVQPKTLIPRTTQWRSNTEGRGLLKLTNNKPTYIHWNDVNELCKRLQLLIASRSAGHSGHDNEILSIIEELHEAGVIKEDAGTVEAIFTK